MTMLTSGAALPSGTPEPARETSGFGCCVVDVVIGSIFLSRRENEFTSAFPRIKMIGLRRFDCVSVIPPAPRMYPGCQAQLSLVQNLVRKIDRAQQLRCLVDYILFLRRVFICLVGVIPLIGKFGGNGQRTWFMARIGLPRRCRDRGRKMRQPFEIKLVLQAPIERRGYYRRQERAIEKWQLKFQPV